MSGETPVANSLTTEYIDALVDNSSEKPITYLFTVDAKNVVCTDGSNPISLSKYLAYLQEYANQGVHIDRGSRPEPVETQQSV